MGGGGGRVVDQAECDRPVNLPGAIKSCAVVCHRVESGSFADIVNRFLHILPWRVDDVEIRKVHRRHLQGLVGSSIVDGCTLEQQGYRAKGSGFPFPFPSFDVAASRHWYRGEPIIDSFTSRPVVSVVVLQDLVYFLSEVGALDVRPSEIKKPLVENAEPWVRGGCASRPACIKGEDN